MKQSLRKTGQFIGLVIAPVLGLRVAQEHVLYLSGYNSFLPGDLFLAGAVYYANEALAENPQQSLLLTFRGKLILSLGGAGVGVGLQLLGLKSGQSLSLALLPSQLVHTIVSFGAGLQYAGAFWPLLRTKPSIQKKRAFICLALYFACYAIDSFHTPTDITVADRQSQRVIWDFRK